VKDEGTEVLDHLFESHVGIELSIALAEFPNHSSMLRSVELWPRSIELVFVRRVSLEKFSMPLNLHRHHTRELREELLLHEDGRSSQEARDRLAWVGLHCLKFWLSKLELRLSEVLDRGSLVLH